MIFPLLWIGKQKYYRFLWSGCYILSVEVIKEPGFLFLFFFQDKTGDKNVKMALKNPKNYVVKPQREGGGELYHKFSSVNILSLFLIYYIV